MKKIIIFFFALLLAAPSTAQKKTTKTPVKKTATTQKKTQKKTTQKKTTTKSKQKVSNNSIKGLQNQRSAVQQKIKQQEKALKANKADVAKRLQNLMIINSEISEKQKTIDGIQTEITGLDGDIKILQSQLQTLEQQLQERKDKYIKSAQYISKHRTVQDKLMFIFSAKNFAQMYRRLRFVRQYAAFQRAQGESIKAKQAEITSKHDQLNTVKGQKNNLLYQGKKEQSALQGKQSEQQQMVQNLQKQQKTIQGIIAQQKKKDAELNARIDKLIAEEVARQKPDTYDGIWACASLLHVPKERLTELFCKLYNALKADGILYVSFKYGENEEIRNGRYFTDLTEQELDRTMIGNSWNKN